MPSLLDREIPVLDEADEQGTKREVFELDTETETANRDRKKRRLWTASRKPVALLLKGTCVTSEGTRWYQGRTEESELFVRECTLKCFTEIWETVEIKKEEWIDDTERHIAFIVTGPPGLGKSWSSNAIVWQLLKKRQNIWFHSASDHTLTTFVFEGEDASPKISDFPEIDVIKYKAPEGTWFLYDSIGGSSGAGEMISFQEQGVCVPCVIFSSPKDKNYKQGIKGMGSGLVRYLWMPSWEWHELKAVMPSFYKEHGGSKFEHCAFACCWNDYVHAAMPHHGHHLAEKTLEEFEGFILAVYKLWGGIPRRLLLYCEKFRVSNVKAALQQSQDDFTSELRTLSNDIVSRGPTIVHKMLDNVSTGGENGSLSTQVAPPSWLVFPVPIDSGALYENKTYKFCSQEAELAFWNILSDKDTDAVRRFCMEVFKVPGAIGIAFERFAHFVLTRTESNTFRWKKYVSDKQESSENPEGSVVLPKCTNQKCEMKENLHSFQTAIGRCISEDKCVVIDPSCDQQDAIDMFVVCKLDGFWSVLAMQDTISKTHSFHPVKILEYRQAAKNALLAAEQEVRDNFFLHVVVVPTENAEEPFRLQEATMAKLSTLNEVVTKSKDIGLSPPIKLDNWTAAKAKAVCKDAKLKGRSFLEGDALKMAGAETLLLQAADAQVKDLTWVLDGFLNSIT